MPMVDRYREWFEHECDSNEKMLAMIESVPHENRSDPKFQRAIVLAAHLAGAKTVLFPKRNVPDLRDIPDEVKQSIELIPVERIEEVLAIALTSEKKRPVTKPVRVKGSSATL